MTKDESAYGELLNEVFAAHANLQSLPAARAELQYIKDVLLMDGYGCDFYVAKVCWGHLWPRSVCIDGGLLCGQGLCIDGKNSMWPRSVCIDGKNSMWPRSEFDGKNSMWQRSVCIDGRTSMWPRSGCIDGGLLCGQGLCVLMGDFYVAKVCVY